MGDDAVDALLGNDDPAEPAEPATEPADAEPTPAEPAAAEPAEPTKPAEPAAKPDTVPLSALHESRAKERELREDLTQTRERMARMETLFEQIQKQDGDGETPIPSFDEDPEGHFRGTLTQLGKRLDGYDKKETERTDQDAATARSNQALERYAASARAFQSAHSDYNDSYQYLTDTRNKQLQAAGIDDPVERTNMIQYEEGALVGRAMQSGKDPAEMIYNLSKALGYAGQKGTEEDKLDRLRKGGEAAKSLSGAGTKGEETMSLERLSRLFDEDPDAADREWEKMRQKGLLG